MGGFRNGTKHIYYYAGEWTAIDYRTLRSRYFKFGWQAFRWLNA